MSSMHAIAPDDVVATFDDANARRARAATGAGAAERRSSTRAGLGDGAARNDPDRRRPLQRDLPAIRRATPELVLRRPPRGPLPPERPRRPPRGPAPGALEPPAPGSRRSWHSARTRRVIGAPFYVMPRVDGHVLTRGPGRAGGRGRPAAHRRESSSTRLVELHAVDCGPPAWRTSAGRRATSSASCGASAACGSATHARPPPPRARRRVARRAPSASMPGDPGPRRLPARQRRCSRPPRRRGSSHPRLGDGDDRRPAGRPRLPVPALGRPRRPAARHVRAPGSVTRAEGFARPRRAHRAATRSAPGARCATCSGTGRWRCGRRSCSWRAATSARSAARPTTRTSRASARASVQLAERAEAMARGSPRGRPARSTSAAS